MFWVALMLIFLIISPLILTDTWIWVHESKFTDLTLDIWTPRFLCIPAQRIQRNTPKFQVAQRGPKNIRMQDILDLWYLMFYATMASTRQTFLMHILSIPLASQSTQYLLSSSCSILVRSSWSLSWMTFSRFRSIFEFLLLVAIILFLMLYALVVR